MGITGLKMMPRKKEKQRCLSNMSQNYEINAAKETTLLCLLAKGFVSKNSWWVKVESHRTGEKKKKIFQDVWLVKKDLSFQDWNQNTPKNN